MKEETQYIWYTEADLLCIPTGNIITPDGALVMDDGVAYQSKESNSNLPYTFASHIVNIGNTPCLYLRDSSPHFCSLPVTFDVYKQPVMGLIVQSVKLMVAIANKWHFTKIAMPQPGCGIGQLDWESEVKPEIKRFLDDRFTVHDIGAL